MNTSTGIHLLRQLKGAGHIHASVDARSVLLVLEASFCQINGNTQVTPINPAMPPLMSLAGRLKPH